MRTGPITSGQGLISIRNEDGTQWLGSAGMWCTTRRGARPYNKTHFEKLQADATATKRNNSPDNGFFGLMNLRFHEISDELAQAQNMVADKFDAEMAAESAAEDAELDRLYGGES